MNIKDKYLNKTNKKDKRTLKDIIEFLIIHHTAGKAPGDFNVLSHIKEQSGVSVHYYIGKDGIIWNLVGEEYIARHTGKSNKGPVRNTRWGWNLNPISIGIELENLGDGKDEYTKEQIKALEELSADIIKRNNISVENVLGHKEITTRKIDPSSNFYEGDIEGFRNKLKGNNIKIKVKEEVEEKKIEIKDNEKANELLKDILKNKEGIFKLYEILKNMDSKTLLIIIGAMIALIVLNQYGVDITTILELIK